MRPQLALIAFAALAVANASYVEKVSTAEEERAPAYGVPLDDGQATMLFAVRYEPSPGSLEPAASFDYSLGYFGTIGEAKEGATAPIARLAHSCGGMPG